jgi:hypothetical protein
MSQNNSSPGIVGYVPVHNVAIGAITSPFVVTGVAPGAAGTVLGSNGVSSDPSFQTIGTLGAVTSITGDSGGAEVPSAGNFNIKGTANQTLVTGTANTETISLIGPYTPATYTAHGVLIGEGTGSIVASSVGATGTVLSGNTGADPTFQALSGLAVTSITGTANEITASASTGAVTLSTPSTFIAPGTIASTTSLTAGNGFTVTTGTSNINGNALFKGPTPWADVVAYGADPTGVASSVAAFNAAIASIPLGGIVWVPTGTYKIDSAITVSTPHIRFCGASRTDSILNNTGTTTNTINLNTFYGGCENLTFTAPANTNTAGFAVSMPVGADYSYVWRCDFTNMYQGIQMNANLSYIDDIGMRTFSNAAANGSCVVINDTTVNCWINKLTTNNGGVLTGFAGVRIIHCGAVLVSNCQLIGATTAMSIEPTVGLTAPSIEVVNTFFDSSSTGLSVTGAGTPARSKFTNCWFSSQTVSGITFNNANMTGFTFVNCDFYGNATGINALAAIDWQVSNSRFAANTTAGIQTTAAATHSFQILNNTIGITGVFGANALGINIQSGTYASYRIKGNIGLAANTTGGITDSGVVAGLNQKEVADNLGATIKGGIAASTSATGAINTGETIVAGGNAVNGASAVIPANSLQIGTTIRITMMGTCTSTAANVSTFTLRTGTAGTTGDASVATAATSIAATSGTTVGFTAIMTFTVRTIGATGTIAGSMLLLNTGITGISANNTQSIPLTATATLNTTTANYIEVTYKSAATTTTSTFQNGIVEIVKC